MTGGWRDRHHSVAVNVSIKKLASNAPARINSVLGEVGDWGKLGCVTIAIGGYDADSVAGLKF